MSAAFPILPRGRLIAAKHVSEFGPDEYHAYVSRMYALPQAKRGAPVHPAPGLSVCRAKAGVLQVRRNPKIRAFAYVTMSEIAAFAKAQDTGQSDIWNLFKQKKYIIARDRLEAERVFAEQSGIPWPSNTSESEN